MTAARFPDVPPQIAALPVDVRGYPVPWFASWIDGQPDFRAVMTEKIHYAHLRSRCWICGGRIAGRAKAFVIGPMCIVNRLSPEPPSHLACARFAATVCPFLTRPMAKRVGSPHGAGETAGTMITRNPGVCAVWLTRSYSAEPDREGLLFWFGPPVLLEWYAEGRTATRAEIMASIESGLPLLKATANRPGPEFDVWFAKATARALKLVPAR